MKYIILYGRQNQSDNVLKSGVYYTRFFAQRKANDLNNGEKHDENKYYFVSPVYSALRISFIAYCARIRQIYRRKKYKRLCKKCAQAEHKHNRIIKIMEKYE